MPNLQRVIVALFALGLVGADDARVKPPIEEGIRWPGEGGKRIRVSVGITIIDFARISPQDEAFEMAGYLDLSWTDPTLAGGPEESKKPRRRFQKGDIWSPELEFVNAAEQVRSEREGDLYVERDGRVAQRVRFSHVFRSPLYLKRFPFDRQTLRITLSPFDPIAKDIDLVVDPRANGKLPGASVPDWRIDGESAVVQPPKSGDPSDQEFVFEVKVTRRSTFYVWRVFLPLALLVVASWSVFWIDESVAPAKFATAVTVLVSLVAFSYSIDFSLPKVPHLTFTDAFSLMVFLYVLSAIFAVTAIHFIHTKRGPEPAERLQKLARWVFPASFALAVAILSDVSLV